MESPTRSQGPVTDLLSKLVDVDMEAAVDLVHSWIGSRTPHYGCFCESNLLANLSDSRTARAVAGADAVFADGTAVEWLAKINGRPLRGRVTGPDFMIAACAAGIRLGWRHFLLGGAPGVAESLAGRLENEFPSIEMVGVESPPFRPMTREEDDALRARIARAEPDILWVALGSPKQEQWVAEHVRGSCVPAIFPVGAAFDFHAGTRRRAPGLVRGLHMEWLFRLATGGRRVLLRNLRCVPKAVALLAREWVGQLTVHRV